jgi:hypothetical protein
MHCIFPHSMALRHGVTSLTLSNMVHLVQCYITYAPDKMSLNTSQIKPQVPILVSE